MHPTAPTPPAGTPVSGAFPVPAGPLGIPGATHMAKSYYDEQGRHRTSRTSVPVNQFGQLVAVQWTCPKCRAARFFGAKMAGTPVCDVDNTRMRRDGLKAAPVLPWAELWTAVDRPLRAVWAGAAVGALGYAIDAGDVPASALAVAVVPAWWATRRAVRAYLTRRAVRAARIDGDDLGADKRRRAAIDRQARTLGYCAAAGCAWLAEACALSVDPHTPGGAVSLLSLVAAWLWPAGIWWRNLRRDRDRPVSSAVKEAPEPEVEVAPLVDPTEQEVRHTWDTVVASHAGQLVTSANGQPVKAARAAKLPGTHLEDWHRVVGGWAATIVGPLGAYESAEFNAARGKIASAYTVRTSMVTITPDPDDEGRALVMIQRTSPIKESPRWAGPASIDAVRGVAPVMVYADGEQAMYEIYRPGWGVPHVAAFGTTGSAKSSFLKLLLVIDRWVQHEGRGLVADFLIDPQQGQSFTEFLDELAGPVACTLDHAILLVKALTRESLRRNHYLAREAKWWDERRKKWRTGREWWNPLVDGPIIALSIDEAHDYLSNKEFATLVTKAGRMWRKCGMQLRISTHTPLLSDLGGQMALRDMLTGGFVWMGRTANALSGPVAFNGRLPVDPRLIPPDAGMAYPLAGVAPKAMLARTMFEEDWYRFLRDDNDEPIGYPAVLPPETFAAFGPDFAAWAAASAAGDLMWTPGQESTSSAGGGKAEPAVGGTKSVDAVLAVLADADAPMDMDELDGALRHAGTVFSTRTVRDALAKLRAQGLVFTSKGRHELTPQARETAAAERQEQMELALGETE